MDTHPDFQIQTTYPHTVVHPDFRTHFCQAAYDDLGTTVSGVSHIFLV
jgi:hypothetical protein